jgi:undecaprenyl-diphosphooligosaccharide--protein glycosyltransferase
MSFIESAVKNRGFANGLIQLPKDNFPVSVTVVLILLTYLLSFLVRLEWIDYAQANFTDEKGETIFLRPNMVKDGVALPNTHDSFYFGSIVQKAALGMHQNNDLLPGVYKNGMITALPYWLIKLFPDLSIEHLLLWLPVYIAGLVCIPIVLIGRLYNCTFWGFGAACLAGITHSYYNRTLAGYYDTDIFAITSPAFSVFFLLAAARKQSVKYLLAGGISLFLGNFFYGSMQAITCSICLGFVGYQVGLSFLDSWLDKKNDKLWRIIFSSLSNRFTTISILVVSWVLFTEMWSSGNVIEKSPLLFFIGLFPLVFSLILLFAQQSFSLGTRFDSFFHSKSFSLLGIVVLFCLILGVLPLTNFGPFSGTWLKITGKLQSYSVVGKTGTTMTSDAESLKFLDVKTTIREASQIPFEVVRNRILADTPTCSCPRCMPEGLKNAGLVVPASIFGLLGLGFLILRYWEFCITLPFLAIAYNCFEGNVGLRFTVHVGNYAAIGLVFLLIVLIWGICRLMVRDRIGEGAVINKTRLVTYGILTLLVFWFATPNLQHAANYHSHVVYPIKTMEVLKKLDEASQPDDFVVTWWDYGSGCWYYGHTRTFTSPAHQTEDNFLTSEILRSTSPAKAFNLARLQTETFVDLQKQRQTDGKSKFPTAIQAIFKDGTADQVFYQSLLHDSSKSGFPLPTKTRDTFLFLPYEILRIFPTILSFSSRNLYFSGNEGSNSPSLSEPPMLILRGGRREGSSYVFNGGYRLNQRGDLILDGEQKGMIAYGQVFEVDPDGGPAKVIDSIEVDDLRVSLKYDATVGRRLIHVPHLNELIIISSDTFRSSFARRFLLTRFDAEAYSHPVFAQGADPRKQPFFTQADWVTSQGPKIFLNMRGGYKIEADLSTNLATLPNSSSTIPFSFHRKIHDPNTAQLIDSPSIEKEGAKFHLIQTSLPYFSGDRDYVVPHNGKKLSEIAEIHRLSVSALSSYNSLKDENSLLKSGDKITIPGMGYQIGQAWFFMDEEAFNSLLVQGYFMENLDENYFEKVFSNAWGKVYKLKSIH